MARTIISALLCQILLSSALAKTDTCLQKQCPADVTRVLLPVLDDCEKFVVCINGVPVSTETCPENHHFDDNIQICVAEIPSNCKECKAIVETTENDDIPQRCIQNSITPFKCPEALPPDHLFPHLDDCRLFYYCVTSDLPPVCRECPPTLHFSPKQSVCDHPVTAGCLV